MRDIRDIIGFYIDLCEHCNPPADVLELDACPEADNEIEAYVRPEMLHHTCAVRVTIPRGTAQDDVVDLLDGIAQSLRDDPTYLETIWQSRDEEDAALPGAMEPGTHVH